jgi:peptide/nickel transport system permease protein
MTTVGFPLTAEKAPVRRKRSAALQSLIANKGALVGMVILAIVVFASLFATWIVPHDPTYRDITRRLSPPLSTVEGEFFLLGTDAVGRDILSRIIFGTRVTLLVGVASVLVAGTVGTVLGLFAGYRGKWADAVIMRIADIQLALPFMVLAIAVAGALGSSVVNTIVVLGVTGWVTHVRVVRAETLSTRSRDYVLSAQAVGARDSRIITKHVLPNVQALAIVSATLMVARMIIAEASLSFLGLGVPVGTPTWGVMISEGREYIATAWWVAAFPGIAILITVMAVNLVGDWLRDVLDPRMQRS